MGHLIKLDALHEHALAQERVDLIEFSDLRLTSDFEEAIELVRIKLNLARLGGKRLAVEIWRVAESEK